MRQRHDADPLPLASRGRAFQRRKGLKVITFRQPSRTDIDRMIWRRRPRFDLIALALAGALAATPAPATPAADAPRHGLAMHGAPALPSGFESFPYVNPRSPKGGRLVLGVQGTFDSLNPFPVKGLTAAHGVAGFVIEPLMRRSLDEPFTLYPLIARAVEMPEDRSAITFLIDERAAFSDGHPVTSADVRFSFDLLRTKGRPNYRNSYDKVAKVETPDPHTIRFDLSDAGDR